MWLPIPTTFEEVVRHVGVQFERELVKGADCCAYE